MIRLRAITRQTLTMRDSTDDYVYVACLSRNMLYASAAMEKDREIRVYTYYRDYGMMPNQLRSSVTPIIVESGRVSTVRPGDEE